MKSIISKIKKLCKEQNLIEPGDKIAVGVSGGKDSLVMLKALCEVRKKFKNRFDMIAICVDLSNGKMNFDGVKAFCDQLGVELEIVNSNVFEIVFDVRKEKNPCSLCANLRRGLLNTAAKKAGCNKVALAHHADDLIETFCMSIRQENRLFVLPAKSYLSRMDLTLIRPMLLCFESEILIESASVPVTKNICPADHETTREKAKSFLKNLEKSFPQIKKSLLNALVNPKRYSLWKDE